MVVTEVPVFILQFFFKFVEENVFIIPHQLCGYIIHHFEKHVIGAAVSDHIVYPAIMLLKIFSVMKRIVLQH